MNKGLLDFLQSASNAVASNVSGPIDLIGMGLNKIGVPVGPAPVGGTDWMKSKGLMRDVEQGPARVLGETAGLLGPALASKFAPQIARGLLQGSENLAAPRRLNKEAGVIGLQHEAVLKSMSKGLPDDVVDAGFGVDGYLYHTPYRPFENAQQSALGVKAKPIAERLFSTDVPLSAAQLKEIEAVPASEVSSLAFSKELADEGAFSFLNKDGKRFSVVMPSAKNQGQFQATTYDPSGAIGDSQHQSMAEAIQRLIDGGYSKILPEERASSLLDRVMLK